MLDVTGPAEVFSPANRVGTDYSVEVVAEDRSPIRSSSGLELLPHRALNDCREPIDTLVVAGGWGVAAAERDDVLVDWVRHAAALLARAGVLDGRRATTERAQQALETSDASIERIAARCGLEHRRRCAGRFPSSSGSPPPSTAKRALGRTVAG